MTRMLEELEQALALHRSGRSEEAAEIGRRLLTRSLGTPQAARVHRSMSGFLLAIGNYPDARELAHKARSLARAIRDPREMLRSSLALLDCDLYRGEVATVYRMIEELRRQAGSSPFLRAFRAKVMLLIGELDPVVDLLEETRTLLDQDDPANELLRARLLLLEGRAHLLADRPGEARGLFERVLDLEPGSLVPGCLARGLAGRALVRMGEPEQGREMVDQAAGLARKVSRDAHGQTLALSGLTRLDLGEYSTATEQLRAAVGLLTHALDRQESFCALGRMARLQGEDGEAVQAYRRATEPTGETLFGREAVRRLKELVGFQVV